jgi:hypothetical protein
MEFIMGVNTVVSKVKTGKAAQVVPEVSCAIAPAVMGGNSFPVAEFADDFKLLYRRKKDKNGMYYVRMHIGQGLDHQLTLSVGKNGVCVRTTMKEFWQEKRIAAASLPTTKV